MKAELINKFMRGWKEVDKEEKVKNYKGVDLDHNLESSKEVLKIVWVEQLDSNWTKKSRLLQIMIMMSHYMMEVEFKLVNQTLFKNLWSRNNKFLSGKIILEINFMKEVISLKHLKQQPLLMIYLKRKIERTLVEINDE